MSGTVTPNVVCLGQILALPLKQKHRNPSKGPKGNHLIFKAYLQERNIQKPTTVEELATVSENSTPN